MITNPQSGTTIDEVAPDLYRISTPVEIPSLPGGFSFNQYLLVDDQPLLFHTGLRRLFPLVSEAIAAVLPLDRLRYLSYSHFEADECGALNHFLAVCPHAAPVAGQVGTMVSLQDYADRAPRALADGESLALGRHTLRWLDTPHLPHGWDCAVLFDETTRVLLCGDLFTQPGGKTPPVTEADILGPSEAFRAPLDYFAHAANTRAQLERLAQLQPATLACMHGSTWRGEGAALLRALADALETR
jgi:flavorubredoxin